MAALQHSRAPIIFVLEPFGGSIRRNNPNLPFIFWDDAAVTRGDGVFETLLVHRGRPVNFELHARRFVASSRALDLPASDLDYWRRALDEACQAWVAERGEDCDARCVCTLTRGRAATGRPSAWLVLSDVGEPTLTARARGVTVMTTPRAQVPAAHPPAWAPGAAKTLNYAENMAALRYARDHGCDDALFIDPAHAHPERGPRVLEAATAGLILAKQRHRLRAPRAGQESLTSTTQQALFAHAEAAGWRVKQRDIYLRDLRKADSVWLVSSVRGATRVLAIDGKVLEPGPETEEVRALAGEALLGESVAG
ncbi:hypothetical protein CATYP_08780 [Corynebacterium atypicum]|uniref:4-amino-4-deoxychorismate lyase n=1 Tax=Corynebacterium atypicum TaxID=191610 RepID=A0ABM5QPD4_9CORY|nr:aminodeoxychorismate lyase [Corynebacterium atypicum]AIG64642.1 hypothetical protein CATYP_08780 [Corynebacterium atypicum]